ncbi:MAG TPA: DNA cytosine methyltransferase [Longimicrobium sp.]|nr:DNA cytosine methyltransferase [Longimicrobium sp.]
MPRTAVDLFCGSGGVTVGLKAADWAVIAAVDNDPVASETYRLNHPEVDFIEADIDCPRTAARLAQAVAGVRIDLLVICAPCQPFSSQNRKRGNDEREQLILKSLALVEIVNPALIFFENVPGLAGPSYRTVLTEVQLELARLGYTMTEPLVKDAAEFGVPQRRRRCIMVASRDPEGLLAFTSADLRQPERTVYDAISRLMLLDNGDKHPSDPLHCARTHSALALERLRHIPRDGGSRNSLPDALELECHKGQHSNSFPDVYGRMSWHRVAPTLTTGCTDVTKGRFAHPQQDRAITLREAARLQTFDDDYRFSGNRSDIARQIGNAVPPAMLAHLAAGFEAALLAVEGQ